MKRLQICTNQLPTVTAETESPHAKIIIRQATIENPEAEIQVLHDNVVNGNTQPKTYKILFFYPKPYNLSVKIMIDNNMNLLYIYLFICCTGKEK